MLIVSREAGVRVGKHAWHVYPLEAFGYLLGVAKTQQIIAALPCSKTRAWYEYDDRWTGIEEHFDQARAVGGSFNLEVVGVYASTEEFNGYPPPRFTDAGILVMLYVMFCCPSCSWYSFIKEGRPLQRRNDFIVCPGKRFDMAFNQRRILKEWRRVFGAIDYSNRSDTIELGG